MSRICGQFFIAQDEFNRVDDVCYCCTKTQLCLIWIPDSSYENFGYHMKISAII